MDYGELEKLKENLSEYSEVGGFKSICEHFCDQVEFEFFLFGVCNATSLSSPKITTITNYPESWFGSYFEDDIAKNDPVVRYCFENISPIRWDKLVGMEKYTNAIGEQIMQRA